MTGWRGSLRSAWGWFLGLISLRRRRSRLDEEIRFHLEMETARRIEAGLPPAEARRAARVAFGGEARFRADAIDEVRSRSMEELIKDVRHAARGLIRTPLFTSVAVLTLALGIGSTTVFYSVADHVVLRPLPYPDSHRLVLIRESMREYADRFPMFSANAGHFLEWRRRCGSCGQLAAIRSVERTLTGRDDPQQIGTARISANLLPMLGARAAIGRLFTGDEDRAGGDRAVILSDALWRRLGADPGLVGRTLTLDGEPWTVIGVIARPFRFPKGRDLALGGTHEIELFTPLALTPREVASPGEYNYGVIARPVAGASLDRVQGELTRIAEDLTRAAGSQVHFQAHAIPLQESTVGTSGTALLLLLAAVATVLLVVSVNLAHLLLARNAGRAREWAVRAAIGARRGRLIRQTMTESLLLACAGGALGIVLSTWGLPLLLRLAPADLPRLDQIRLDGRILAVAVLLSVLVGVGFGALPAWRSAGTEPADVLRGSRPGRGANPARGRRLLIGLEAALCAALLYVAGLFLGSFVRVTGVDPGFAIGPVLAADLSLPFDRYRESGARNALYDQLLDRLAAAPGVTGAALATALPLEGDSQVDVLSDEHDIRPEVERPLVSVRHVSPGYFETIGTPLVRGRTFESADRGRAVVVLSERAAGALWPDQDPIGRRVVPGSNDSTATVIGVVGDIRTVALESKGSAIVYLPYWSRPPLTPVIMIRAEGNPEDLTGLIRGEVKTLAPAVPLTRIRTMPGIWNASTAQRRFQLVVLVTFAVTAIVTVAVGIFGIVAHSLGQRTAEIGLRLALGARPGDVHRQILREGLVPVAIGLGVGLAVAIALGRFAGTLLYGIRPADPPTLAVVALLLLAVAALASWIPARRATMESVVRGLRTE